MMDVPTLKIRFVAMAGRLRQRVRPRTVVLALAAGMAVGTVVVAAEALVRARLGSIDDRVPSALVTRPVGWDGSPARAILVAPVAGAPSERREPVAIGEFPDHLIYAVLAVEDQRFREHHGLDLRRIGGAMAANVKAGGITQGGSTITQQLAKNLYLHSGRTPLRKFRELAMAVTLEARYDKEQILEAYLNEIYFGQDGGRAIHGIGAAARFHFGKDARKLSLAESALLAAMIRAPNRLAPLRHPDDARARRDLVLDLMVAQGRATPAEVGRAKRARMPTRNHSERTIDGRYFRDLVASDHRKRVPLRGEVVHTTLDAGLQRAAERAVQSGLARDGLGGAEAALVAIDPRTGEVLALVGGRDYGASQFNRATAARRQPGSAFKPVVAAAALAPRGDEPPAYTLASVVQDEPFRVRSASGTWEPVNYDRTFRGDVTVREALQQSLNVPFARIGMTVGPEEVVAMGRRLGITSPLRAVPSLALGSSEVTLLELVRAYGVLASGGLLASTRTVFEADQHGQLTTSTAERVLDPRVAYLVTSALQGAVAEGTGRAIASRGAIAGKTGTTNDWRDAWFIAYTPSLVVGVWVGHDDGTSLRRTGATAALPIVSRFLAEGAPQAGRERFDVPDGIVEGYTTSGGGWFSVCTERELFIEGTEPETGGCIDFQVAEWNDDNWNDRAMERLERLAERTADREMRRLGELIEREARAWMRQWEGREN
ncbi:MAG: PBP1A family penicillin-binding protein [Gemmatimonadales bacterium]|nr:PBP1A family penicillin-binding protein [Gemmatimonadales bacterium]MDZ4390004.1 PBP1A family penicillin-binding protein [Gemmatimonadales bacterium]